MEMGRPSLAADQVQEISNAVSDAKGLRLPARMTHNQATRDERLNYLTALLTHDPGVFLERHGQHLDKEQRASFETLRDDYEIDFYLKLLEDQTAHNKHYKGGPSTAKLAKNRRLAKLNRLDKEGFFEEEALRKRAPLLHHQYLGRYSKPKKPSAGGTGSLHDRVIAQEEEAQLQTQMATQKQQEDAAAEAFEATLSESESEGDDEETKDPDKVVSAAAPDSPEASPISAEELEQNRQDLQSIMKGRFLDGRDGGDEADLDASLDDDWAKEETQDAEDKYFES